MYEATVVYNDNHVEKIDLLPEQKDKFVSALEQGSAYRDEKLDLVFWLPPKNLRLAYIIYKSESQSCLENQSLEAANASNS